MESQPNLWTATEAAEWLGVSTDTLYGALGAGEIPGRKVGREWRLSKLEIARWFDGPEASELPELLTVEQVSRALRTGRSLTYRLVQEGEIPSRRVGRQYFVSRGRLDAYLSSAL